MIVHHVATVVLLYFSWVMNFVPVGTLVLLVHDAADSWLAVSYSNPLRTIMCLSIGTPKNNKFSICSKWKINYF